MPSVGYGLVVPSSIWRLGCDVGSTRSSANFRCKYWCGSCTKCKINTYYPKSSIECSMKSRPGRAVRAARVARTTARQRDTLQPPRRRQRTSKEAYVYFFFHCSFSRQLGLSWSRSLGERRATARTESRTTSSKALLLKAWTAQCGPAIAELRQRACRTLFQVPGGKPFRSYSGAHTSKVSCLNDSCG